MDWHEANTDRLDAVTMDALSDVLEAHPDALTTVMVSSVLEVVAIVTKNNQVIEMRSL